MSAIVKLSNRLTESEMNDEVVIMRVDNGEFFSLAETAATIWRMIDGKRDRAELAAAVASELALRESEIQADVDEFVIELAEAGLVAER
jgi:hypothetical protein